MKIQTGRYIELGRGLPNTGQHILCHQDDDQLVVYQAYNHSIADYAVENQCLGGPNFSYNRMSWIKPNFLWMMYRCGWASKENQERALAIWISKAHFENILNHAVLTSFNAKFYKNHEEWNDELNKKDARLQWDPDHDPFGGNLARRAIQIGMKGKVLDDFGKREIKLIEDITDFVQEQKSNITNNNLDKLLVPVESVYRPSDEGLRERIGVD